VLQHSILGNLSHPKAVELAERLALIAPGTLNHVYFAADGASATEAALKIAIQYWWNLGNEKKTRFVALAEGYHGDTLGAVGVGFVPQFHAPFKDAVVRAHTAAAPHCTCCRYEDSGPCAMKAFESMRAIVEEHHETLAAVIVEPLCQGAAGIRIYHEDYLRALRNLCNDYDVLLIADEIAVGFGRTGDVFACQKAGIVPDILCVGKALTAGYLPMSAAIATDTIYESFRSSPDRDRTFYDGHTYCGNPITAAAALAAIDIYTSEDVFQRSAPLALQLAAGFARIAAHECIAHHKTLGTIAMCAVHPDAGGAATAKRIGLKALELGLFIRPLGDAIYLWPPLVSTEDKLSRMLELLEQAIHSTEPVVV
jgi:adenosylmethionine-8-amino-7-oxononanoate aminotransferase